MKIAFLLPWNQDIAYWTQWADDNGIDGIELLYSSMTSLYRMSSSPKRSSAPSKASA